jgi:predicted TIM-barrel fold metal-dependent hydrolase
MSEKPELIDLHHHIVPEEYVSALAKIGVNASLGRGFPEWDVKEDLDVMDRNGISSAILSVSAPGVYFKDTGRPLEIARDLSRQTNEICAGLVGDHPERFGAFATLPLPDVDAALEEIRYSLDILKLDGVTLFSNYDGYYLGDPRFDGLLSELNRRKAVVFVHPCTPPGMETSHLGFPEMMMDVCFDTTRTAYSLALNGMLRKYPDIRFILAHAGGAVPYLAGRVKMAAAFGTRFKDAIPDGLEYYLKRFYYDTALSAFPYAFASLKELAGSPQIVFGTDYPFAQAVAVPFTIKGLREYAGFNARDVAAIEGGNATNLFPRLNRSGGVR